MFACYNPNFSLIKLFLNNLETHLFSIDIQKPLFVVGDLNIDFSSPNISVIEQFLKLLNFSNYVCSPTRLSTKRIGNNVYSSSLTLIDVVLHNNMCTLYTAVVGFPFSDHCFDISSFDYTDNSTSIQPELFGRSYTERNLLKLKALLESTDFSPIFDLPNPELKLQKFNDILTGIVDLVCPVRKLKNKSIDYFP